MAVGLRPPLLPFVANSGGFMGCSPPSNWNFFTKALTEVGDVSEFGALRITLGVVGASGKKEL